MVKGKRQGRNSFVVSIRLPDYVRAELDARAEKKGLTIEGYIKNRILYSVNTTEVTRDDGNGVPKAPQNHSVNTPVNTTKPTIPEMQAMIDEKQGHKSIPWYVRGKHKTGDRVRMRDAAGRVQVVTVPELDAEGVPVW